MPTINQLIKKKRIRSFALKKKEKSKPQILGTCLRVFTRAPKKPNSAARKVAFVRLRTGVKILAYIPGEGHTLQEHAIVLVRGGRVKDLPGVKYHLIRGVQGLGSVVGRKNGRSKVGTKRSE